MERIVCNKCSRPESVCYCSHLVALNNRVKLLIIQHPQEVSHPFNTARIVALCLSNVELTVAELLDEELISRIENSNSLLLYPDTQIGSTGEEFSEKAGYGKLEQLIVLDASWKKSKKMLFSNPALQKLPRLSLSDTQPSQYRIRKSAIKGALSTLESVVEAYKVIEPESDLTSLMRPFERMIQIQKKYS